MRYLNKLIVLLVFIAACKQHDLSKSDDISSANEGKASIAKDLKKDSLAISVLSNDTVLTGISADILNCLKTENYNCLAEFIHPEFGLRFSPYGSIDTVHDQVLSKDEFLNLIRNNTKIKWGIFDGTGEPINLTVKQYFKRFVYDVDFINAEKKSVNKIVGETPSLNNIKTIYPNNDFTEFYFSGFDPKYQGMDWKALVLVFKKDSNKTYLAGIVHDQWRA